MNYFTGLWFFLMTLAKGHWLIVACILKETWTYIDRKDLVERDVMCNYSGLHFTVLLLLTRHRRARACLSRTKLCSCRYNDIFVESYFGRTVLCFRTFWATLILWPQLDFTGIGMNTDLVPNKKLFATRSLSSRKLYENGYQRCLSVCLSPCS